MREPSLIDDEVKALKLRILVVPGQDGILRIRLWHRPQDHDEEDGKLVWSKDYRSDFGAKETYETILFRMLTEAHEELPSVLTDLGCQKRTANRTGTPSSMDKGGAVAQ